MALLSQECKLRPGLLDVLAEDTVGLVADVNVTSTSADFFSVSGAGIPASYAISAAGITSLLNCDTRSMRCLLVWD